ncbi:ferrous iron transport protein B [Cryomorpha ignava]|uniref:Ferrous iron transport protein B n=1 Tax=Cryomorpha ignava TaxID=101383 RepID=A0A7K3WNL0_9FLAO|nr:ferrous iron transport protein B [Cryomorpha ignava]NEN23243.1 ferrous iron transport protein B [Cryomorpha ignava]
MSKNTDHQLIALTGVPNVGKTTIFNNLTGLNQKVGNYPGVTVDKKIGKLKGKDHSVRIVDLPGTYNLYPRSEDEQVVFRVLCGLQKGLDVDAVLAVADMSNLERGLFLVTQLIDLGYPAALILNMEDQAAKEGTTINRIMLERLLGIPVFFATADRGRGLDTIKQSILDSNFKSGRKLLTASELIPSEMIDEMMEATGQKNDYRALQVLKFRNEESQLSADVKIDLNRIADKYSFKSAETQSKETELRYDRIRDILSKCVKKAEKEKLNYTRKLDAVFLHKSWGFLIFLAILFLIFQTIFSWAEGPMDLIDTAFAELSQFVSTSLPAGALNDLISQGIIPGLGGIVIFVPQIALLFAFLAVLEGSGYMARAVFITDRLMRPFGLNGRSVVPLISGFACAIPAIMATRTISNRKDRLITIFVTPFMSCSARLPVYIVLVGLLFPEGDNGFFNYKGASLFLLYFLGIFAALISAWAMKQIMRSEKSGNLVLELPRYQWPSLKTVGLTMYEKSKTFVVEAGRIILAISIILWVMASYGPPEKMAAAEASVVLPANPTEAELQHYRGELSNKKLEASYAAVVGHWIEPVIRPLGYDWKIGIALVCSFAAREVFVSTVATLYSIGNDSEDITTLKQLMANEKNDQGEKMFTPAVVWSLLIFYAFAMQCMSTIAVVYRETKSIKWPLLQTVYMTVFAYLSALLVYQILS